MDMTDNRSDSFRAEPSMWDVVVVGGGVAGLSAALTLARARRTVLVLDAGQPRNAPSDHAHGYLTRDGIPPLELTALGRDEVVGYGGVILEALATGAEVVDGGFRVTAGDREWQARRLLVTTGLTDQLPDVPGLAQRWGRDVLHCPYCHGWEVRDQPLGVLATSPGAVQQALLFRQWSPDVTLFTHTGPDLTEDQGEQLAARGIAVVDGEVTGLDVTDDRLSGVRLDSGRVIPRSALVVGPRFDANGSLLAGLGAEILEHPMGVGQQLSVDATGATTVPGVWAAGNVSDLSAGVVQSAAAGVSAAAAVNHDLVNADAAEAVAARRAGRRAGASAEFWEAHYRDHARPGVTRPNPILAETAAGLPVGAALDLGCGEGGDTLWLAEHGWQVTAVDVSQVVLDRAAARVAAAGLSDRVRFERHDLSVTFPVGAFDLVSVQYLHSPVEFDRRRVLQTAAEAVAPGGVWLVVDHASVPPWSWADPETRFPSPADALADLDVPLDQWEVLRVEDPRRSATGPDGRTAEVTDTVIALTRG